MFLAFAIDGREFEVIRATESWDEAAAAIRDADGGYDENEPVDLEQVDADTWRGEGTGISLDFEIRRVAVD